MNLTNIFCTRLVVIALLSLSVAMPSAAMTRVQRNDFIEQIVAGTCIVSFFSGIAAFVAAMTVPGIKAESGFCDHSKRRFCCGGYALNPVCMPVSSDSTEYDCTKWREGLRLHCIDENAKENSVLLADRRHNRVNLLAAIGGTLLLFSVSLAVGQPFLTVPISGFFVLVYLDTEAHFSTTYKVPK